MTKDDLKLKDKVYYARILSKVNIYEVCELIIRTIEDGYFVGTDKHDKHAYLFSYKRLNDIVFFSQIKDIHSRRFLLE